MSTLQQYILPIYKCLTRLAANTLVTNTNIISPTRYPLLPKYVPPLAIFLAIPL